MTARPVEAVLVVYYGPEAHHVTYGRNVRGGGYTKDYIQLSRLPAFLEWAERLFPRPAGAELEVPLRYEWPGGSVPGDFVYESSDRPHLKWETSLGAPQPWRMTETPSESTSETIPGDPARTIVSEAEAEYESLGSKGAGRPYLVAVKLRDEAAVLHVRAYLDGASATYDWARLDLLPLPVQEMARRTTQRRALAWELFDGRGVPPTAVIETAIGLLPNSQDVRATLSAMSSEEAAALSRYLRDPGHGLFFDPARNHDAWIQALSIPDELLVAAPAILEILSDRAPSSQVEDLTAETLATDETEVEEFREQIEAADYSVPDSTSTVKTRGSAQRAFADAVKRNYGHRCAITGVKTHKFLVASHIVPWSEDQTIRLDPSNGICLSLVVDRAFESGFLRIDDDLTIRVDRSRVGDDGALLNMLDVHDGQKLNTPTHAAPNVAYLQRRRELIDRLDESH